MAEPHSTAISAGLALGTVTLTGSVLGLHYDAIIIGFLAALVSLLHLPPKDGEARTPWRVFSLVVGASFLAAAFAPAMALAAETYLPWTAQLGRAGLRMTAAALIGAGVHVAIPLAFGWLTRRAGGVMSGLALLTVLAAAVVIVRSICVINRLHWTTTGHGYAHFIGFGFSYILLAAGALLAAIDAAHGMLSLAGVTVVLASAGLILFDKRGPRR